MTCIPQGCRSFRNSAASCALANSGNPLPSKMTLGRTSIARRRPAKPLVAVMTAKPSSSNKLVSVRRNQLGVRRSAPAADVCAELTIAEKSKSPASRNDNLRVRHMAK
jgi:hypothetical protein